MKIDPMRWTFMDEEGSGSSPELEPATDDVQPEPQATEEPQAPEPQEDEYKPKYSSYTMPDNYMTDGMRSLLDEMSQKQSQSPPPQYPPQQPQYQQPPPYHYNQQPPPYPHQPQYQQPPPQPQPQYPDEQTFIDNPVEATKATFAAEWHQMQNQMQQQWQQQQQALRDEYDRRFKESEYRQKMQLAAEGDKAARNVEAILLSDETYNSNKEYRDIVTESIARYVQGAIDKAARGDSRDINYLIRNPKEVANYSRAMAAMNLGIPLNPVKYSPQGVPPLARPTPPKARNDGIPRDLRKDADKWGVPIDKVREALANRENSDI